MLTDCNKQYIIYKEIYQKNLKTNRVARSAGGLAVRVLRSTDEGHEPRNRSSGGGNLLNMM